MGLNQIALIGNLGKDPELRYTPQGIAVCDFSLAVNEKKGGEEFTLWFKVTAWRQTAEACSKYLQRGKQVYVTGRLGVSEYEKRDGTQGFSLEVNATDVHFLSSSQSSEQEETRTTIRGVVAPKTESKADDSGDIPF